MNRKTLTQLHDFGEPNFDSSFFCYDLCIQCMRMYADFVIFCKRRYMGRFIDLIIYPLAFLHSSRHLIVSCFPQIFLFSKCFDFMSPSRLLMIAILSMNDLSQSFFLIFMHAYLYI